MADLTDNQKRDNALFYVEGGDPGFSPDRNKAVIEGTIKKYEAKQREKAKQYKENVGERSDAVASYLQHLKQGKNSSVEKYFGRRELARLRGEKILRTLKRNYLGQEYISLEEVN